MSASVMTPEAFLSAVRHTVSTHEWNADTRDHFVMLLQSAGAPLIELADNQQIRIELDYDYEPDGDYDLEEERAKLRSGEWGAYSVLLQHQCECGNWITDQSLSGVVVDGSAWDAEYGTLEGIEEPYLRSVAAELITEQED